jgi:kynureninase
MAREVGDAIAPLIGAPAGSVSMCENVTTAHMSVLSTLAPPVTRDAIVCSAADFPSMVYLFRAQEALGYRLVVVPANDDGSADPVRIAAAIDDRTALVAVSHVLFRSSFILDPAPIVEKARLVGAPVMLDLYQAAGIIPVDVRALGVDFAAGGCLKWLCGGPGTAFLYTRPDLAATLKPRFTGWFSHRAPFAFDIGEPEPRGDAMRMMNGTPSIPAFYAALPGLDIIRAVGVPRIRAASIRMTAQLLALADRYGFPSPASRDPERLAGTVAVNPPDALLVSRTLKARDFVVDYRAGVGIRMSPHFYNTAEEIDRLMAEMAAIVEHKAYDAGAAARSVVT